MIMASIDERFGANNKMEKRKKILKMFTGLLLKDEVQRLR
jgi:hypothetical protein